MVVKDNENVEYKVHIELKDTPGIEFCFYYTEKYADTETDIPELVKQLEDNECVVSLWLTWIITADRPRARSRYGGKLYRLLGKCKPSFFER